MHAYVYWDGVREVGQWYGSRLATFAVDTYVPLACTILYNITI